MSSASFVISIAIVFLLLRMTRSGLIFVFIEGIITRKKGKKKKGYSISRLE